MANRIEDRIRDYLFDHIELIEERLTCVAKEYALPNLHGAGGRIDLLAKDIFGYYVVIEIKRSDQTARQALNEIFKYTALFRINQGLDESRIRLIVVSTEWHELLLPLSEFAETTQYAVEGKKITIHPNGVVEQVSTMILRREGGALKISRSQCAYLYRLPARRDQQLSRLIAAAKAAGVEDFSILRCDYVGNDPTVIYPAAHYLCFSSPLNDPASDAAKELKARLQWEDGLFEPDENFIIAINATMIDCCDNFEVGYPEKLTSISENWALSIAARLGRLSENQSVLTNENIITMGKAVEGGSDCYLGKISSPRFVVSWRQLRKSLELVLIGNGRWQEVVPRFLDEVEANSPAATVSISIYNPTNLFLTLYWIAWNQDYSRCPRLEILVDDQERGQVRGLIGCLAWDRQNVQATPEEIMNQVYGDFSRWMTALAVNELYEDEDSALAAHHLASLTVEWLFERNGEIGPMEVLVEDGHLCRRAFNEGEQKPLTEFSAAHVNYLASLKAYLANRCAGLPGFWI